MNEFNCGLCGAVCKYGVRVCQGCGGIVRYTNLFPGSLLFGGLVGYLSLGMIVVLHKILLWLVGLVGAYPPTGVGKISCRAASTLDPAKIVYLDGGTTRWVGNASAAAKRLGGQCTTHFEIYAAAETIAIGLAIAIGFYAFYNTWTTPIAPVTTLRR